MILSDENNIYITHETIKKIINTVGFDGAGLYLTIRSLEFDNPQGIEEIRILKSSSDDIESSKKLLKELLIKGYVEQTKEGLVKVTNKRF